MKKTLIILAAFIGVLFCAVGYSDSQYRTAIGRQAPDISLKTNGGTLNLDSLRGHYVLLNFWKSTDAPSRRTANDYTAWLRRHRGTDINLVSVNLDDSEALYREILRRDSLIPETQFHVEGNNARAISDGYGLEKGLGTMLISPEGKILVHNPSWDQLNAIGS